MQLFGKLNVINPVWLMMWLVCVALAIFAPLWWLRILFALCALFYAHMVVEE